MAKNGFDRKAFPLAMKTRCGQHRRRYPGLLIDWCFDDQGDIGRESVPVEVKNGKQAAVETLPPLKKQ